MKKAKFFKIQELVPPQVYTERGQTAWELIDPRLIMAIDWLRETYGPITINNWDIGGKYKWSGLRTPGCKVGAKYSQHRYGRAADCKFHNRNINPAKIREKMKHIQGKLNAIMAGITCVENKTGTWLHVDVRNCKPIKWVNP